MQKISLLKLFFIFVKIGAILLGGGYVILPILMDELVKKRNLIEQDELINFFALSQSLPGIVAANISMFIGYKLRGKIGAVITMLGVIAFPFLSIILIATLLDSIVENQFLKSIFWGISISVIVLIFLTAREVWQKCNKDLFFYFIFIFSLIELLVFKFSPVQVIIIMTIIGVAYKSLTRNREKC